MNTPILLEHLRDNRGFFVTVQSRSAGYFTIDVRFVIPRKAKRDGARFPSSTFYCPVLRDILL